MAEDFNPLVSIVIPVYNGENYMREAIDSALGQTYKNIEVIVVNDGSKDRTDEIARSYGDKIRYFKKENGGVSTALNLAIKNMKGEYFSWLSHDDVYLPEKIETQIEVLRRLEDKRTVVNCLSTSIDASGKNIGSWNYTIPGKYRDKPLYYVFSTKITGCGLLLHKIYFEKLGDFDTSLRIAQDYAMWFKIFRQRNTHIYHVDKALVKVRQHVNQVTNTSKIYFIECDKFWTDIIEQLTNDQILYTYRTMLNFYTELSCLFSIDHPKRTKKIYTGYRTEYKKSRKNIHCFIESYKIETHYLQSIKSIRINSWKSFLAYLYIILKLSAKKLLGKERTK